MNKGAIRLTTARYYTPSGRSIQATGIEPDYDLKPEIPQNLKLELASLSLASEAQLRGHLKNDGAEGRAGSIRMFRKKKRWTISSMRPSPLFMPSSRIRTRMQMDQVRAARLAHLAADAMTSVNPRQLGRVNGV